MQFERVWLEQRTATFCRDCVKTQSNTAGSGTLFAGGHAYGNSKVHAPERRTVREAYLVGRWLLGKSASRLRRDKRMAAQIMLSVRRADGGWADAISCLPSCDTAYFLKLHRTLWVRQLVKLGPSMIFGISVHLGHGSKLSDRPEDLLLPIAPATTIQFECRDSGEHSLRSLVGFFAAYRWAVWLLWGGFPLATFLQKWI